MDEGLSLRSIAATMGVSPSTIQRDIAKGDQVLEDGRRLVAVGPVRGMDGKVRPSRRVDTSTRDARIRELRAAGETIRAIAAATGCSVGTVHRVLKR